MELILGVAGVLVGAAVGFAVQRRLSESKVGTAANRAREVLGRADAESQAKAAQTLDDARRRADEIRAHGEREIESLRADLDRREKRLEQSETQVFGRATALDQREQKLDGRDQKLSDRELELDELKARLADQADEHRRALERVAAMSSQEARKVVMEQIEDEAKRDALAYVREIDQRAREEGERRARQIVITAIQRLGTEQAQEASISVLQIPSEEMKGRIIGREGRNIKHFEQVTGVNLIIDDTPEAVVLSCFDPVRREKARLALEALVGDGRIHPARIEEQFERAHAQIEQAVMRAGEDAILDVGITNVHVELVRALGRLRYRYSYGQNVLRHVIEASHLAGMIAAELGSDVKLAKRCTLFHDIGKAVAHEVEGSHAFIGAELARQFGEAAPVVHAIEAHHGEIEMRTLEAVICQAADGISGGRPGARREDFEAYVKRLERLEQIAKTFAGVDKVYAMQAGREVRVMVRPSDVDDVAAQVMAREIAKRIEEEIQYPGQIRVVVLREVRSVEYAR